MCPVPWGSRIVSINTWDCQFIDSIRRGSRIVCIRGNRKINLKCRGNQKRILWQNIIWGFSWASKKEHENNIIYGSL